MKQAVVLAPCKVNLTLDITGRRDNGYHDMEMVLLTADLCDRVTVTLTQGEGIQVSCDKPGIPLDDRNLAVRAARLFWQRAGQPERGLAIWIEKNIPMEAGLAGGSADGAAVLVALNVLAGSPFTMQELEEMALPLGADVPFCLRGGVAIARGIGEKFTPLPPLPDCYLVLAKPWEGVSTAQAFHRADSLGIPIHPDTQAMAEAIQAGDLLQIGKMLYNVLEPAAELPVLAQLRELLTDSGALGAVMTGSGSAVVGLFGEQSLAEAARERVLPHCQSAFVARPYGRGAHLLEFGE